jgi:hypothetical protein
MATRTIVGPERPNRNLPKEPTVDKQGPRIAQLEEKVDELVISLQEVIDELARVSIRSSRAISKVHELNGKYARVRR